MRGFPADTDPNKQCSVPSPAFPHLPCPRSLTCKSHSMGSKRAVRRSKPFDILLNELQRNNLYNNQIAAAAAAASSSSSSIPGNSHSTGGGQMKGSHKIYSSSGTAKSIVTIPNASFPPLSYSQQNQLALPSSSSLTSTSTSTSMRKKSTGTTTSWVGELPFLGNSDPEVYELGADLSGERTRHPLEEEEGEGGEEEEGEGEEEEIDSDEEVKSIFKGLSTTLSSSSSSTSTASTSLGGARPFRTPLGSGGLGALRNNTRVNFFVARNSKLGRLREVLGGVFGGM